MRAGAKVVRYSLIEPAVANVQAFQASDKDRPRDDADPDDSEEVADDPDADGEPDEDAEAGEEDVQE